MNPKIIKAIADMLRASNPVAIREVPNAICYQVEIGGVGFGSGHTLEEAVGNALEALSDE